MNLSSKKIIIIGGGIGGLTVALALAQRGADVTVLEQATEISDMGAGLQISPNGFVVLEALGLRDVVTEQALAAKAVVLRDYRQATKVAQLTLAAHKGARNYFFIHRADLVACLLAAAKQAGVCIALQQKVKEVHPSVIPRVVLSNGAAVSADLVIGADGLHSCLRPVLNGARTPRFTGQVAWRALVPDQHHTTAEAQLFMGPGRHVVTYPLRKGRLLNVVAVQERTSWAAEGWQHRDDPENLARAFADFDPSLRGLLAKVDDVHLWGLFRHPVARVWHRDHTVLATSLAEMATTNAALAQYQSRRERRVRKVIAAAGRNAWKYHLRMPLLRKVAHFALQKVSQLAPQHLMAQLDWLYHHDVTKGD
jgi:salicylate hydroxylase